MTGRSADREFVREFLHLYRQHPALWKVKSKEYSNKCLKNDGYEALVEKYREIDPNADKEMVKRKINILRTNYRKEFRKIQESSRSRNSNDIYETSLWYYDELSFLQDQDIYVDAGSRIFVKSEDLDLDYEDEQQLLQEEMDEHVAANTPTQVSKPSPVEPRTTAKRRKTATSQTSSRDECCTACACKKSDEYENIAAMWANELKKMSAEQQIHAKKAINDILYEGQLGTLHRHSVTINDEAAYFATSGFSASSSNQC